MKVETGKRRQPDAAGTAEATKERTVKRKTNRAASVAVRESRRSAGLIDACACVVARLPREGDTLDRQAEIRAAVALLGDALRCADNAARLCESVR